MPGPDDTAGAAGAAFAGYSAACDSFEDRVLIRDVRGGLVLSMTRAQIAALAPWMSLDAGPDGPGSVAFTATGRAAFILVHDDTLPADGLGSDAILRYDLSLDTLTLFARADLFDRGDQFPHLAAAHHRAILYVATATGAGAGTIRAYLANAGTPSGSLLATWTLPGGGAVRGLAVDRDTGVLFAATDAAVYRTTLTNTFTSPPTWTLTTTAGDVRDLAWGDAFGGPAQRGLYILRGDGAGSRIDFLSVTAAYWPIPQTGVLYHASPTSVWHALGATGDGRLVVGRDEDALAIRESTETALGFDAWMSDEVAQVIAFGRGLISPDGQPAGWVIDADVPPGSARFHPATPDAAAWTVLLLLASDDLTGDAQAQGQVRQVLTRYAGLAGDGIAPGRTADGIFRHWIDPATGGPMWDGEFATLSTMKINFAAARAASYYPDDEAIALAASRIIFRTRNWDSYVRVSDNAMFFRALAPGGPDTTSSSRPFHEGVIFTGQAGVYGGPGAQIVAAAWLNRPALPSGAYIPAWPITSTGAGAFDAAFTSIYPALVMPAYRQSPDWRQQLRAVRWSNAAWTDDSNPQYSTVFSAGTTRSDWGGYRADNLAVHPGDVTTFPSMMGLATLGEADAAAGAYHAYRRGARQLWKTGASLLYRRSSVDRAYLPDSAGLPDVALGALGLAEVLSPGFTARVLALPEPRSEMCPVDRDASGATGLDDLYVQQTQPVDLNADGATNAADTRCLMNWVRRRETRDLLRP